MNVAELREELKKFPDNLKICTNEEGILDGYIYFSAQNCKIVKTRDNGESGLTILKGERIQYYESKLCKSCGK